jgi:hypothetical protein
LILFAILNIVFITKKGIFIHSLINMIVFSVAGLSVLAAALDGFTDRASDIVGVFYCDPGMGSPDSWYRGNFEECKAFRVQYAVISWIFLVFGFFNGYVDGLLPPPAQLLRLDDTANDFIGKSV